MSITGKRVSRRRKEFWIDLEDRLMASMQYPFPAPTHLELDFWLVDGTAAVIPDLFLGGSASLLEVLVLTDIVFPTLPNLLLSAKDLVELSLFNIPDHGYISPEMMVATLSSLTRLTKKFKNDKKAIPIPSITPILDKSTTTSEATHHPPRSHRILFRRC